jgi:hypothetical protein
MEVDRNGERDLLCSNVKHMEEIRESGFEMPAVNQIEVGFPLFAELLSVVTCAAPSSLPTTSDCRLLP